MDRGFAPAKVNLALHVTGRGADGYHRLDSLVVFAGVGDQVTAAPARDITLAVSGPFARGVPTDGANLALRAAHALARARGVERGAALRLVKALPHAAGIGSASSDAAATLRLLAHLWKVEPFAPGDPEALALGSDVPACLLAPGALRMSGRGETVEALAPLGSPGGTMGLVLVNPGVALPTRDVFAGLASRDNPGLPPLPEGGGAEALAAWMAGARNDLQAPAEALAPQVGLALALLRRTPGVLAAAMSGSGGTCVGLTRDMGAARQAARAIQVAAQAWWVVPAAILG